MTDRPRAEPTATKRAFSYDRPEEMFQPNSAAQIDDTRTWVDPNGYRLSDRIWLAREADRQGINNTLQQSLAAGDGPEKTSKRLVQYLTPAGETMLSRSPRAGMGNYAARRLSRTETTRAFGDAAMKAALLNPFVKGMKWMLSGSHTEPDECNRNAEKSGRSRQLGPGEYELHEVPRYPNHPNELCTLSPVSVGDAEAIVLANKMMDDIWPEPATSLLQEQEQAIRDAAFRNYSNRAAEERRAKLEQAGPPKVPKSLKEAQAYASDVLGIPDVVYGEPGKRPGAEITGRMTDAAHITNQALYDLALRGVPLPPKVRVHRDPYHADAVAYYASRDQSMVVNVINGFWRDPRHTAKAFHDQGWLAGTTPQDIITHEVGHAQHIGTGVDPDIRSMRDAPAAQDVPTMAQVSRYGQTSYTEFVAETFGKKFRGEKLSPEVEELYRRMKGPELP